MGMYGSYFFIFIRAIVCIIWYGYVSSFGVPCLGSFAILMALKLEFKLTMGLPFYRLCFDAYLEAVGRISTILCQKAQTSPRRYS